MNVFSPSRLAPAPARAPTNLRPDAPVAVRDARPTSPFAELGLSQALVRAVEEEGYAELTPIQAQAIPHLLEGKDLLGCAQTGTGKTAAFVLPMLQHLAKTPRSGRIRALVLSPTRELAAQIGERVWAYGRYQGVRHTVIYGGVGQRGQEQALARRPEFLVATPGRLLDLMSQGLVRLDAVEIFVLDEADRMLDMGFIHDVRRVIGALPSRRQTLLFSATIPRDIVALAQSMLVDPVRVSVTPAVQTADGIEQSVYFVSRKDKRDVLARLLGEPSVERALVFTRTKRGANRVALDLGRAGIEAAAIHGNKSQGARERALEDFRRGRVTVLVATDIAARGIDVHGISHVINYELPNVAEGYVHRVGRTARAGATGRAISFCDAEERGLLRDIERLLGHRLPVAAGSPPSESSDDAQGGNDRQLRAPGKSTRRRWGPRRRR